VPGRLTQAVANLEAATAQLLEAAGADLTSLLEPMTARSLAVKRLRDELDDSRLELSPDSLERIETCRRNGDHLHRRLLARRASIRSEFNRLSEREHLLHALPQDRIAGLKIDAKG
jgi:hypothetical protein